MLDFWSDCSNGHSAGGLAAFIAAANDPQTTALLGLDAGGPHWWTPGQFWYEDLLSAGAISEL